MGSDSSVPRIRTSSRKCLAIAAPSSLAEDTDACVSKGARLVDERPAAGTRSAVRADRSLRALYTAVLIDRIGIFSKPAA